MPKSTAKTRQKAEEGIPAETREFPTLFFDRAIPETIDDAERTVELVVSTGAKVTRRDWWTGRKYEEQLALDPDAVRLDRLNGGAPLLDSHNGYDLGSQIGVVEKAWLAKGELRALVRFSKNNEAAEPIWLDVKDGIIRSVSVGYIVHRYTKEEREEEVDLWTATDWEPVEVSMVAIPADPRAGVRSAGREFHPCVIERASPAATKESPMAKKEGAAATEPAEDNAVRQAATAATAAPPSPPAAAPVDEAKIRNEAAAAERTRQAEIRKAADKLGLSGEKVEALCASDVTLDSARAQLIDLAAESSPTRGVGLPAEVRGGQDEFVTMRSAIANALLNRFRPDKYKLDDSGRQYRGLMLHEICREVLERRGVRTRSLPRLDIVKRATAMHATSDFPAILADVANKTLRAAYAAEARTFTPFCRQVSLQDFKPITRTQLSAAPDLDPVGAGGEYTFGDLSDGKETYKLAKFGKILSVQWEAIVNDDLDAFTRIPEMFGASAARKEADLVYSIFTQNPIMGDGTALFDAAHANVDTNATALSIAQLGKIREAMRKQTGLQGERVQLTLTYLLVPAALETKADQLFAEIVVSTRADAMTPRLRNVTPIVEARLDDASLVNYFGIASPSEIDTIEYAYLDGYEQPFIEERQGYEVDGVDLKCRHVVAAKAIDWRGFFKQTGA